MCYSTSMKRTFGFLCLFSVFLCAAQPLRADSRLGADNAAPEVSALLETLPLRNASVYNLTDRETEQMIDLASRMHINVFEILDCSFRYLAPKGLRISVSGSALRKLQDRYNLGGERVLKLLAVDKFPYLEIGAHQNAGQCDLDIYLASAAEAEFDIGTGVYETRFGFRRLSPLCFDDAYGITVRKLFISTPLEKLELFAPGKGAIHVKGLSRPKRWNLDVVRRIAN